MWVAIEATTLSSAPLLYFNHNPRSLEATWKYLLIGSVGIALALLGSFFLAYSAAQGGLGSSLLFEDLVRDAPHLSTPWLHAAFVLLFVGYGTKMGLAPMHTWKPDAYGEAPGVVGALLAGGLTNCAFLAILRVFQICNAAGEGAFARDAADRHGARSRWRVAGVFMAGQRDFKRMLAYSSVEHMGILVLGIGIGGLRDVRRAPPPGQQRPHQGRPVPLGRQHPPGLREQAHRRRARAPSGALPVSGALFLAGFFAITGSPPFGPFVSEFTILNAAVAGGRFVAGRALSPAARDRLRRHGRHRASRGAGRAVGGGQGARLTRSGCSPSARRWPFSRSCCCWASTSRARVSALLHEAAAFLELKR